MSTQFPIAAYESTVEGDQKINTKRLRVKSKRATFPLLLAIRSDAVSRAKSTLMAINLTSSILLSGAVFGCEG